MRRCAPGFWGALARGFRDRDHSHLFSCANSAPCDGRPVTPRTSLLCTLSLLSLAACSKDDKPFLLLPELCVQRSEAICSARAFSCEEAQRDPACQTHEEELCTQQLELFDDEEERDYYAPLAASVRNEEQIALDEGEPPFPLARYFDLGLELEAECERDSQCELGFCDPDTGLCAEPAAVPLCGESEE